MHNRHCRRTRRGGVVIGSITSLDDEPWVVEGILEKNDGKDFRETRDAVYAFARSYEIVEPDHLDHAVGCTFCSLHAVLTRLAALDTEIPA